MRLSRHLNVSGPAPALHSRAVAVREQRLEVLAVQVEQLGRARRTDGVQRSFGGLGVLHDLELCEKSSTRPSDADDGEDHDPDRARKHGLSTVLVLLQGFDGEGEGDGAAKAGEPHDELESGVDLIVGGSDLVDEECVGEDVECPSDEDDEDGEDHKRAVGRVLREGEGGQAEVDEHKRLGQERNDLEKLAAEVLGLLGEVVEGVVGHDDAAEEDGDDTRKVGTLGHHPGHVREDDDQRALHEEKFLLVQAGLLVDDSGDDGEERPDGGRADEDLQKVTEGHQDAERRDGVRLEDAKGSVENNGDSVVEHGLAKNHGVQVEVGSQLLEDGQDSHGVGGRDQRSEHQRLQQSEGEGPSALSNHVDKCTNDDG
mmetsp:Transcript_71060/g.167495  ORF Transcript_71060/g.167495 Transcript_71060/m.167495 type:complete len:371 (-) Transcript_71060:302-1414(-)